MPLTRCPGCLQELDVEPQWLGELVRCDACQTEFNAIAAGELDKPRHSRSDDFEERPRRRRPAYDDAEVEPRPRRRRPPKKSSTGKVLLILGGAAFIMLLGCAGLIAFVVHAANEKAEFAASDWQLATMPDGQTTALFPGRPSHTTQPGLATVDTYTMLSDDYDIECTVSVSKFGKWLAPTLDEYTNNYESALQSEADATNFVAGTTTYQGCQARDFSCDIAFDDAAGRIVHVPGANEDIFYVIIGLGLNLDDADRQKFLNSLKIAKTRKL